MAETIPIRPADLLIDPENPRLSVPQQGQRDAQRTIAHDQQKKILALATDIVKYGLNPADLPIVMPNRRERGRYIVLEGNRRLAALLALENPEGIAGSVSDSILKKLRKLGLEYRENPIGEVACLLVKDADEARHWIELRHTGENEGAGIVPWGSDEAARFRARSGKAEIHSQALDFIEKHNLLTPQARRDLKTTNFKRLLGTPEVQAKVGVGIQGGELTILGNANRVAKALHWIVKDLTDRDVKVKDIYSRNQRISYARRIPSSVAVTPRTDQRTSGKKKAKKKKKTSTTRRNRDILIRSECILSTTDPRSVDIEVELRRLSLEHHTNAVAVLLRVFIELSVDWYIAHHGLSTVRRAKLRLKIDSVVKDLLKKERLAKNQASGVRQAIQKGAFLGASIDLMNDYVHNNHVFPAPSDLRAHWDSLEPFMMAMLSR